MYAMTGRLAASRRRQPCSSTRLIVAANIHENI